MLLFPVATAVVIGAFLTIIAATTPEKSEASDSFSNSFAGVQYLHYSGRDGQPSANAYKFNMGTNVFNDSTIIDLSTEFQDEVSPDVTGNQLEIGLRSSLYPMNNGLMGVYGRVAVGQQWYDGVDFSYWSVEPGIEVSVDRNITANLGYRYRNAFDSDQYAYDSSAAIAGIDVKLNENHAVNVGYEYSGRDQKYDMVGIGYRYMF